MQAYQLIKYGEASDAFRLTDLPTPKPGKGQICIGVEAFGINYADVMARQGLYNDCPPLPAVIGYDVVGRVIALGTDSSHFKIGDRVTAMTRFGGYATEVVTMEDAAVKITEDMDAIKALALTTQYGTAWYMATKAIQIFAGDKVLIHAAAGGVGQALVQIALKKGATIFGTAGSEEKIKLLPSHGVHHPINYRISPFEEEIKKILGREKMDVVFDNIGGASVKKGFRLLGAAGRLVLYGAADMSGSRFHLFKRISKGLAFGIYHPAQFMMASKSLIGVNMLRLADERPILLKQTLAEVVDEVSKGHLCPSDGNAFSHTELSQAHRFMEERKSTGKIGLYWNK